MNKRKEFDFRGWSQQGLYSQSACNASGLMHSALKCLQEWRDSGGDFDGRECLPFRFMVHQISFLCGVNPGGITYGGGDDYARHTELLNRMLSEAETDVFSRSDLEDHNG